jgi:type I restriction enzyme S subunit
MEVKPLRQGSVPAGYKQTEVGVIPEGWEVSTVGREFEIKLGKMLDAERNVGVPKPYLGNRAVQWNRIDISDLPIVPMSRTDIDRFRLHKGDLLACEGGEVGRAAIWEAPIAECYYQKALHRLRPLRGFNSQLMVALLKHWSDRGWIANYVTQTSIAHLPREKFMEMPMPVPPSAEQEAIAVALSDADALIESLEQLLVKKRQLKQGAMQELLTGKKRLPGFSGEWEVKRLGDVATLYQPVTISAQQLVESGFPVYGANGIVGYYDKTNHETWQVTVTCRGSTCGTINRTVDRCWITGNAMVLNCDHNESISKEFFFHLLSNQDLSVCITGTGQPQIVRAPLAAFEVSLPSTVAEQSAIAAILSDMDAEIAALEAKLAKARQLKQGMMQELLTGRVRLIN